MFNFYFRYDMIVLTHMKLSKSAIDSSLYARVEKFKFL